MRSTRDVSVLLSCLWALGQAAACGSDGASDGPKPGLLEDEPHDASAASPTDAGSKPSAVRDATAAARDDGAEDEPFANWHLPTPGACGEVGLSFASEPVTPGAPDWREHAKVPVTGLANRYGFAGQELTDYVRKGKEHTVVYPVDVTASWLPQHVIEKAFSDPLSKIFQGTNPLSEYKDLDDFERWLGLSVYPDCDGKGASSIPFPGDSRPEFRMGSTRRALPDGDGLTYSCAGCHASRLFGRSILGLQNRAPHANVGIDKARKTLEGLPVELVQFFLGGTEGEMRMLRRLQEGLASVEIRPPLVRGLDTSLVQVALSLNKRLKDPYATRDAAQAKAPRPDPLDTTPADSKPGNWWVLKYKNRWLLDGSVVSGNPVYTNLIWNEIGRGTDLKQLEGWLDDNQKVVDEITAAVFAMEPVRFTEFFPAESLDLEAAKRGKQLFDGTCATCHGTYKKGWELPQAASLTLPERLATVQVRYHEDTPVFDVGTDGLRNKGMESLVQLNDLSISKSSGVIIKPQTGYVPPPLDGIWARWPYFHNNSAPSLCAVLTRASERPATYYAGEANDPKLDFDATCNGYPVGAAVPAAWLKDSEALFDSKRAGLGNQGHDEGVFLKDGQEMFTPEQKHDIIVFLQTL
jgi:hypothetical protein